MAVPGSGNSKIPADFVQDGAVLKHLPGLLTVLRDGGFSEEEAFDWLFRDDDSLPGTPVQALRTIGTPRSPAAPRPWRCSPAAGRAELTPWGT